MKATYRFVHDKYLSSPFITRHLRREESDRHLTHYGTVGRYQKAVHPTRGIERLGVIEGFYYYQAGEPLWDFQFMYYHGENIPNLSGEFQ